MNDLWKAEARKCGYKPLKFVYPPDSLLCVEESNIRQTITGLAHKTVLTNYRRLRERFPNREIYVTIPSKITKEWKPKS